MSGCSDKRFEKMLYAYELGLLSQEECDEFEIHLYECEHCFERARKFSQAAEQLRHNPLIRESVRGLAKERLTGETIISERGTEKAGRWRFWQTLVPVGAAAVIALMLLLFKPFGLDFKPGQEAIAYENRLAIMYFENLADPTDSLGLSEIATNLLITDLGESAFLQVMSGDRLMDILRLMGMEGTRVIDKAIAMRIAKRAQARWIVMGNILQVEPGIILTGQLIDVKSGNIEASQKVVGGADEDIFSMVDRLTVEIRHDLALPAEALREEDRRVADLTSHSTEAYRHYLNGRELYQKFYYSDAIWNFEKALDYDSTLAMAYYYLAYLKDARLAEKAIKYSKYASQIDRYYINALDAEIAMEIDTAISEMRKLIQHYPEEKNAYQLLGRYLKSQLKNDEAIASFEKAVEIDPLYKNAVNELAYLYNAVGDFGKAIESINKYIKLAPEEANPYDSRGDIYASNGKLDEAIESYEAALERKPDFFASLRKLGELSIYRGDYARVDSICDLMIGLDDGEQRLGGIFIRALLEIYRGEFSKALPTLDTGLEMIVKVRGYNNCATYNQLKAHIYETLGNYKEALNERAKVVEINHVFAPSYIAADRQYQIQTLAQSGNYEAAEKMAQEFYDNLMENKANLSSYWYAHGYIKFAEGNYEAAIADFEKVLDKYVSLTIPTLYMLGRSYQQSGRFEEAIDAYEKLLGDYGYYRLQWGIWSVQTHYYLGICYEESENLEEAIRQYQKFLNIWKDTDHDFEELDDTRTRLNRLSSRS
jgi:tetratricopeptide (TPR) repeat protein